MPNKRIRSAMTWGLTALAVLIAWNVGWPLLKPADGLRIVGQVRAERGHLKVKVEATGDVKPYNRVEIKPPIAGRVEEVRVREGDLVTKGQILALLSSTERATLLDAARMRGEKELKRWEEAYKAAPLIAPLDGTLIVRSVEPGQSVTSADPVVVIADRLIVEAQVDETDLSLIRLGQKTEIRLDAYPSQVIPGKVDHVDYESKLVTNVNVYAVDVLPETTPDVFRSGMTANVTFIVAEAENALLLPSEAIAEWPRDVPRPEGAEFAVYTKSFGGKLKPNPIRIGQSDGQKTEILEGLKEGATVQLVRKPQSSSNSPFAPPKFRKDSAGSSGKT